MDASTEQPREALRARSQDILATIQRTEESLTRQLAKAETPPAESGSMQDLLPPTAPAAPAASGETNFFELSADETKEYFQPVAPSATAPAAAVSTSSLAIFSRNSAVVHPLALASDSSSREFSFGMSS